MRRCGRRARRAGVGGGRPAVLAALLALTLILTAGGAPALGESLDDWEQTALTGPVAELFAPASGAFFARTDGGLFRSDDGGASWRPVNLPPVPSNARAWRAAVDPTDHTVLYVSGEGGLYKSSDDAATWTLVLPTSEVARGIAVSPADRGLVYLGLVPRADISSDFRFLRSRDGGATWEQLEEHHNSLCGWGVPILLPHPSDAGRVFRTAACVAGRDVGLPLRHSADQGATWTTVFGDTRFGDVQTAFPVRLVGGRDAAPARFYLAANRDSRTGGSSLFRSDDDGGSWTEVLAHHDGTPRPQPTNAQIAALAYDPARPDRVYVGVNEFAGQSANRVLATSRVRASADGGATWSDLGQRELGTISDLALGIDGQSLYAASDRGVWRLPVGEVAGRSTTPMSEVVATPIESTPVRTLSIERNTQAFVGDVAIGAGNFHEDDYTAEDGAARRGLTAGVWIAVRDDPGQNRQVRVHPGQEFAASRYLFRVTGIEPARLHLAVTEVQP
jgi:hypothetical protein